MLIMHVCSSYIVHVQVHVFIMYVHVHVLCTGTHAQIYIYIYISYLDMHGSVSKTKPCMSKYERFIQ